MSDTSWWQRKLGGGNGQAPSRPQATPNTWNTQRAGAPAPAWAPPPQAPIEEYDSPDPAPPGQIHALDAVVRFKGSKSAQKERELCPNCSTGGRQVYLFSRAAGQDMQGKQVRLTKINTSGQQCPPASVCFECGYNGIFETFGGSLSDMNG